MSINDLADGIKVSRRADQRALIQKFLMDFIGPDKKYDYVGNKLRAAMRKKVGEL